MNQYISRRIFLCLAGGAPLAGGDFWKKQRPAEWSVDEAKKILTDSPWAKSINVTFNREGMQGQGGGMQLPGGIGMGGGMGGGRGGGRGGSMGGGMGGPGGSRPQPPEMKAVLLWASALPVRQAELIADEAADPDSLAELTDVSLSHYILELRGMASRNAQVGQDRASEELHATTSLKRKDKRDLSPHVVDVTVNGSNLTVRFHFPKHDPILLKDKEVEFTSSLGPMRFKRKFKIRPMIYGGELAL